MKGLQRRSDFSPENHIAPRSNFAAKRSKASHFSSYLPIENPSKRSGASPPRKFYFTKQSTANSYFSKIAQKTAFEAKGRRYIAGKVIQRLFIIDLYT